MLEWAEDLKISDCDLYLDSRQPRGLCFVSHAHSDHIGIHDRAIATAATAALTEHRLGQQAITQLPYNQRHQESPDLALTMRSAGHILGSAMLLVERADRSLLYTGDFKLRASLTVEPAEPVRADVLVM